MSASGAPDSRVPPLSRDAPPSRRARYVAGVAVGIALIYTAFVLINTQVVGPTAVFPFPWLASWLYVQDGLDILAACLLIAAGALLLDRLLARDAALQHAALENVARVEAQRRLLADTSHELRNPLTVLRANLALIQDEEADLQLRLEAARDAEEEAARLSRLVDDLLLLGRGEAGDMLNRSHFSLDALLEDVAAEAREAGTGHDIRLEAVAPAQVVGDPERLRQVLRNLVGNALRHTPPTTTVSLSLRWVGAEAVEVRVADTGPGIPAEHQPRVFDRFYRVDGARSRGAAGDGSSLPGGVGLGLAIVKHLVEAHGGSVTLESTPMQGTTVRVRLPASRDRPTTRGTSPSWPRT